MKTVTVLISPDGEVSLDLAGFHGQGCAKVMKDFTDGAGQIKREVKKREYAESDTAATRKTVVA
jgi:hypothetical protein